MIRANSLKEMDALLEKARKKSLEVNPHLEIIETGLYRVQSSTKGKWYEVRAGRDGQGGLFIACPCRGGLEHRPCYHAAKVFFVHQKVRKMELQNKDKEDQKNSPYFSGGYTKERKVEKVGNHRI